MTTQELAQKALNSLKRMEETARSGSIKYDWNSACEGGTQLLHNTIGNQRNQLVDPPYKNLWEYVKYVYRTDYFFTEDLSHPDEDILEEYPKLKEAWNKCRNTLNKLPAELPDSKEEFQALNITLEDLDALSISLWEFYDESEDGEASFEMGDDGTDEAEQALETLKELLQIFLPENEIFFIQNFTTDEDGKITDCLQFVALITLGYQMNLTMFLNPNFNALHFNFWGLREIRVILERIAEDQYPSDLSKALLHHVIEDSSLGDIGVTFRY